MSELENSVVCCHTPTNEYDTSRAKNNASSLFDSELSFSGILKKVNKESVTKDDLISEQQYSNIEEGSKNMLKAQSLHYLKSKRRDDSSEGHSKRSLDLVS